MCFKLLKLCFCGDFARDFFTLFFFTFFVELFVRFDTVGVLDFEIAILGVLRRFAELDFIFDFARLPGVRTGLLYDCSTRSW